MNSFLDYGLCNGICGNSDCVYKEDCYRYQLHCEYCNDETINRSLKTMYISNELLDDFDDKDKCNYFIGD